LRQGEPQGPHRWPDRLSELHHDTNDAVGNGFPWENSTGIFATFRNQYLFPSALFNDTAAYACTIESVHARSSSFVGGSTNVYGAFPNGDESIIDLGGNLGANLDPTFDLNSNGYSHCRITGNAVSQITINTSAGPNGATRSDCASCVDPAGWCQVGSIEQGLDASFGGGAMWENKLAVYPTGNSGAGVWETSNGAPFGQPDCGGSADPQRAYGSGNFANPNHMTTALGVDAFDFLWVFKGLAPPPPATVEMQIAEIIRLLLTPEGLRCSGLDLTPGNNKIEDDALMFPGGANWDPVQPTVSTGKPQTGDELQDSLRSAGFRP
jgi:hypothetical protein